MNALLQLNLLNSIRHSINEYYRSGLKSWSDALQKLDREYYSFDLKWAAYAKTKGGWHKQKKGRILEKVTEESNQKRNPENPDEAWLNERAAPIPNLQERQEVTQESTTTNVMSIPNVKVNEYNRRNALDVRLVVDNSEDIEDQFLDFTFQYFKEEWPRILEAMTPEDTLRVYAAVKSKSGAAYWHHAFIQWHVTPDTNSSGKIKVVYDEIKNNDYKTRQNIYSMDEFLKFPMIPWFSIVRQEYAPLKNRIKKTEPVKENNEIVHISRAMTDEESEKEREKIQRGREAAVRSKIKRENPNEGLRKSSRKG